MVGFWNGSDSEMRRHLHRKTAGLPDAALDLLDPLLEVRVAGIDVAPGVEDGDDRLAGVVAAVKAHLRGARAVAEGAEILDAVPAMASEFFGLLAGGGIDHLKSEVVIVIGLGPESSAGLIRSGLTPHRHYCGPNAEIKEAS